MSFLELVEGPLWTVAAAVFTIGVVWKIVGILLLGRKKDLSIPRASATTGALKGQLLHFIPHGGFTFRTLYHLIAGYAFHIGLFFVLLFAAPHVAFVQSSIVDVALPTMSYGGFIIAAQFAFAGLILLWIRRISDPVMIKISDKGDHIGSWLTFLVMLSGCMALQESVEFLRAMHMLLVDLWLIYFPFSRLMHAVTFVFSRGYTGAFFGRRGIVP